MEGCIFAFTFSDACSSSARFWATEVIDLLVITSSSYFSLGFENTFKKSYISWPYIFQSVLHWIEKESVTHDEADVKISEHEWDFCCEVCDPEERIKSPFLTKKCTRINTGHYLTHWLDSGESFQPFWLRFFKLGLILLRILPEFKPAPGKQQQTPQLIMWWLFLFFNLLLKSFHDWKHHHSIMMDIQASRWTCCQTQCTLL